MTTQDHSGLDLLVSLEHGGGRPPLRSQLEHQLRDGVRAGRLRPGTALPSTRALAADLGVSRGVVVEAYAQLAAEGFLVTRRGAPARVAEVPAVAPVPGEAPAEEPAVRWDLRAVSGELAAFPRRAWLNAVRTAVTEIPDAGLGYRDQAGAPALREALAAYLGRARGVTTDPGRVVVTGGIQQALGLLAGVLRARGVERVAVEDPGFPVHVGALRRAGLCTVRVGVDQDGLRVDGLVRTGAGAVLVTPAHQFPLGAVLAPDRRLALLDWAADTGALVIEDDYDGEFRHDRPLGALQGLGPAHVAYLGSVSKTLAPALRLGWVAVPPELAGPLAKAKIGADGGSPAIDQHAFAHLIASGGLDRHLRRMRLRYRRRRDLLLAAVGEHLPGVTTSGEAAGLHFVATLPEGADVDAVLARAWAGGVAVHGFPHEGRGRLLVGYANLPEPSVTPAVRALAAAMR